MVNAHRAVVIASVVMSALAPRWGVPAVASTDVGCVRERGRDVGRHWPASWDTCGGSVSVELEECLDKLTNRPHMQIRTSVAQILVEWIVEFMVWGLQIGQQETNPDGTAQTGA